MQYENYFPVIQTEIPHGIYHPLPFYGEQTDWRNVNRHPRNLKEIDDFCEQVLGSSKIQPCGTLVMGILYDPKNQTGSKGKFLKDVDDVMLHHWSIMQIIKMGPECFSTALFPTGASATYGDWVQIEPTEATMNRFKNHVIVTCSHRNIRMLVESPLEAINS